MKSKILVHVYSYKDSELVNTIDALLDNLSQKNLVDIYIDDQNNLTRYDKFLKHKNVFYNPVWWDDLLSPLSYRASCVHSKQYAGYDYFLFISRSTKLGKDWDETLISLLPDQGVLSGKGLVQCFIQDNFYIQKDRKDSDEITNTGVVDHSFIFGKFSYLSSVHLPYELKYFGIDEYLSMSFLNQGIEVYSLPSNFYTQEPDNLITRDYVPFSLNHNYNLVIDILKGNRSETLAYQSPEIFINKIGVNIDNLYRLPFSFNDIEYNRFSELDLVGGKRYIEKRGQVS